MKKIILILTVFMIAAVAPSCTRRYAEKQSTSDAVACSQGQKEQKSDDTVLAQEPEWQKSNDTVLSHEQEKPKEYKKLVVLRVSQITGSHFQPAIPLVLLENYLILSNRKARMLYLLRPGDTVVISGDKIIGYNLKNWHQQR